MIPSILLPQRPLARRLRLGAAALVLALAGCGGGTSQQEPFVAKRVFAFGDEYSALTPSGRNYSINALGVDGGIDCLGQPTWVQSVASVYGFVFPECNPGSTGDAKARTYAAAGATVADVAAQVEAQVANGGFRDKDLATVLVGANDIVALYRQFPLQSEGTLVAEARARGLRTAQIVNRLISLGVKVLVADVPDQGVTPFARAEKAAHPDVDRAALLSRLSEAFNEQLGVSIVLDGRFVGLVQANLRIQTMVKVPGLYGLGNVTHAACTELLPNCTSATVITDALNTQYLWADDRFFGPAGHSQLAQLAIARASGNPF